MSEITLYYEECGEGEPLILLHGNGESQEYFEHQKPFFAVKYHVYALDTRGHGKSPRGEAPFTIRQFAEDLHDFMDEKQIPAAHILGFSDGGNIALTFALKYPERVKCLILNGANLSPFGVKRKYQRMIELKYRLACSFGAKKPENQRKIELLELMIDEPNIRTQELAKLTMPVLVLVGTKDMIKETHSRMICENLPNGSFAELEGDHFIASKNPEEYNRTVAEFLERNET